MEYIINFEGNEYELPNYSLEIAGQIEKVDAKSTIGTRCYAIYNFLGTLLGKSEVVSIIGEYKGVDPNRLELIYAEICSVYASPISKSNIKKVAQLVEDAQLDKIEAIVKALELTQDAK